MRNRRNRVVGIVTDGGMSGYRADQILGISETAVAKIRRTVPADDEQQSAGR